MNVYYDYENGSYYKINKQTGQVMKSSKNGTNPIKFKIQYSGSDYLLRKEKQRDLSPSSIIKEPFRIHYDHKHTKFKQNRITTDKNEKSAEKTKPIQSLRISQLGRKSAMDLNSDRLTNKLKDYAKLRENMGMENHSSRVHLEGSLPALEIPKQYNQIGIDYFASKKGKLKKNMRSLAHLRNSEPQFPQNLLTKNQIKRQKQIYQKYHPIRDEPLKERKLKEIRDRKQNLKILEKLQLEKNDKVTCQVYE